MFVNTVAVLFINSNVNDQAYQLNGSFFIVLKITTDTRVQRREFILKFQTV